MAIVTVLLLIPIGSLSHAELWDLIIIADMENSEILPGQAPVISGVVVDHASKPVEQVAVQIRSGQELIHTQTDENGEFKITLGGFERMPGTYIVNISANTNDGKKGITNSEFLVKGEITPQMALEKKLSTPEAKKYLNANKEDFQKNPIGFALYNYYQKINQEYIEKIKIHEKLKQDKNIISEQQKISKDLRIKAIEEFNPRHGVFTGYQYDDYVNQLNPEIKDTVIEQLNFTKNLFEEAQLVKEEILFNGGTYEEARQAYLEKVTVTKNMLENFDNKISENESNITNSTEIEHTTTVANDSPQINEKTNTLEFNVDGIDIKFELDGKTLFVNVNGTVIELFVNSTGIHQVN